MNRRLYISILTLLLVGLSISAQTNTYDIISKKDTLGILKVSKSKVEENAIYNYQVDMKVKLLVNIHMKYTIEAIYNENQLIYASVANVINGKPHHSSGIKWLDSYYLINTKNNKQQKVAEKIDYSGIRLFFDEPFNIKKVFSEYTGLYGMIKNTQAGTYVLTLPNGKKNKYFYNNGELVKANIHNSLIQFDLVLRK